MYLNVESRAIDILIAHRWGSQAGNDDLRQRLVRQAPAAVLNPLPSASEALRSGDNEGLRGFAHHPLPDRFSWLPVLPQSRQRSSTNAGNGVIVSTIPRPIQRALRALWLAIIRGVFRPSHWPSSGFCFGSTRASRCADASPDGRPPRRFDSRSKAVAASSPKGERLCLQGSIPASTIRNS
jgi:hypothetical protein